MAGIRQNKQKCVIFILVPRERKSLIRLEQKEEYSTSKKKIHNNNNSHNSNINNNVKV